MILRDEYTADKKTYWLKITFWWFSFVKYFYFIFINKKNPLKGYKRFIFIEMYTHSCDKCNFSLFFFKAFNLLKICLRKFVFMHFKAAIQNSINFLHLYFSCKIILKLMSKLKLLKIKNTRGIWTIILQGKGRKIQGKGNLLLHEKLGFRS